VAPVGSSLIFDEAERLTQRHVGAVGAEVARTGASSLDGRERLVSVAEAPQSSSGLEAHGVRAARRADHCVADLGMRGARTGGGARRVRTGDTGARVSSACRARSYHPE